MSEPCTVVIGAQQLLDALREQVGGGEVLSFTDRDVLAAVEAITSRQPGVVALERLFAATSRGAALINRIKADPALVSAEIRVVAHDGSYSRVSPRRPGGLIVAAPANIGEETPAPVLLARLDFQGTRRVARYRMGEGTEAQVDGASAQVVDLSVVGAQVVTSGALRPQQRVRMTLADHAGVVRFNGAVAWASFEIPNSTPRYRAGIEFTDAEAAAIEAFRQRHQLRIPE